MFKLILNVILSYFILCSSIFAQDPPSGYSINYKFRKWNEGAYPSADSINKNIDDIDLSIKNRDLRIDSLKNSFTVSHNYPSGTLKSNTVGSSQIIDGSITSSDLGDTCVSEPKLKIGSVTPERLNSRTYGNGLGLFTDNGFGAWRMDVLTKSQFFQFTSDSLDLKNGAITPQKIVPWLFRESFIFNLGEQSDYQFAFSYEQESFHEYNNGFYLNKYLVLDSISIKKIIDKNSIIVQNSSGITKVKLDTLGGIYASGEVLIGNSADNGNYNLQVTGNSYLSGTVDINTTTGTLRPPRMTATQRNNLTAVEGDIVYNTTTNKLQVYSSGIWVDLH